MVLSHAHELVASAGFVDVFAVPARFVKGREEVFERFGWTPTFAVGEVEGFAVELAILPVTGPVENAFRVGLGLLFGGPLLVLDLEVLTARVEGRDVPLHLPRQKAGDIEVSEHPWIRDPDDEAQWQIVKDVHVRIVRRFAQLTGLRVDLSLDSFMGRTTPFPVDPGFMRVLIMGFGNGPAITHAFGEPIVHGMPVRTVDIRSGEGEPLMDDHGQAVVQRIGNNCQLLIPTLRYFDERTTPLIVRRSLVLAYRSLSTRRVLPKSTSQAFALVAQTWAGEVSSDTHRVDAAIVRAQSQLASLLAQRRAIVTPRMGDAYSNEDREARWAQEYERVQSLSQVATVTVRDRELLITTRSLAMRHMGKHYAIGSFLIRIGGEGTAHVWCQESRHPQGLHHPHIMQRSGYACFGNVQDAINRAIRDLRISDAALLVLRWLVDGYNEDMPVNRIEEWPFATPQEIRDTEADLPPPSYSSEADPEPEPVLAFVSEPTTELVSSVSLDFSAQCGIFNPADARPVTVIGAGSVGSQVVMQLARMGCRDITVWDADAVQAHNVSMSRYRPEHVGMYKVEALARMVQAETGVQIKAIRRMYVSDPLRGSVVACVDTMEARTAIWSAVRFNREVDVLVDTRTAAGILAVHCVFPNSYEEVSEYEPYLYPSSETIQQTCGQHGIIYLTSMAASVASAYLTQTWSGKVVESPFRLVNTLTLLDE